MTLADYRRAIDAADDEIAAALSRRFALTDEVRELRSREGLPARDEAREREVLARVVAAVPAAHRDTAASVYERIFGGARGLIETIARGVAVRDGKVLVCRAKGGRSSYLPGGHVEFGETAAEALVREVREELGVESRAGRFLGVVENSFLQHGRPHSEINLVYALELAPDAANDPVALEDWIEFEWREIAELGSANLLPAEMAKFVEAR